MWDAEDISGMPPLQMSEGKRRGSYVLECRGADLQARAMPARCSTVLCLCVLMAI